MDAQFWINAWNEGKTNFHQKDFNAKLLEFFPQLNPQKGQKILVPLCGKTKDLVWLASQGLDVHGVELYERPVSEFFIENNLTPEKTQEKDFIQYKSRNITISAGDFFNLNYQTEYDLIYDRASLVALPAEMRKEYAKLITKVIRKGGKILLIVYEYDQSKMEGPPFSITEQEIKNLYGDHFDIKLLESKRPANEGPRLAELVQLEQKIYLLKK